MILRGILLALTLFWAPYLLGLPLLTVGTNPGRVDLSMGGLELALQGLSALAGLVVWVATRRLPVGGPPPRARARVLLGAAFVHLTLVLLVGAFVTEWAPATDDESAYLLQGRDLLQGSFSEPSFPLRWAVRNPFVVDVGLRDGVPHWASCYSLLAGLLTAPGVGLGFPHLLWVLMGPLAVYHTGRLAEELWAGADGELAAALTASSPALVSLGAHMHTSLASMLLAVLSARLLLASLADARRGPALGAALAAGVLARPMDGALMVCACVLVVAMYARKEGSAWIFVRIASGVALGAAPFAAAWGVHNHALTGSALKMPYTLIFDGAQTYGLGWGPFGNHTLATAESKTLSALVRMNGWTLGWPVLLLLWPRLRSGRWGALDAPTRVIVSLIGLHLVVYALAPFGAVPTIGTTYHVWLVPCVVLLLVEGWRGSGVSARRRALALGGVGWLTFVPLAMLAVRESALSASAPARLGETLLREHGPVIIHFFPNFGPPRASLVFYPPVRPRGAEEVIWVTSGTEQAFEEARARWPTHRAFEVRAPDWGEAWIARPLD